MNDARHFNTPLEYKSALGDQEYIAGEKIATIMFLSQELGKPLLVEGPAGVGKTELGKSCRRCEWVRTDPPAVLRRVG